MSTSDSYKTSKEAFVSGMTGSTVARVNLISVVALASIILYSALRTRIQITTSFPAQYIILIMPLLLSMTVFANYPGFLSLLLLLPASSLLFLVPPRESGTPLPSASPTISNDEPSPALHIPPLPGLTTYRAHMMLMTVLAILAVDFPVFPRSLAKCETFGVSLMDLGVGSFVFSQGLVSALPLIKNQPSMDNQSDSDLRTNTKQKPDLSLTAAFLPKLRAVLRRVFPLIVLGLIRVVLVKGSGYPEHESEYGTHWNFFLTLAVLPVFQLFLHPIISHFNIPISAIGIIVAITHQMTLSSYGLDLQNYVLSASRIRSNWVSANKEGLISLGGYLSIHMLGLSTGTLILPASPSYFRRMQTRLFLQKNSNAMAHKRRTSNFANNSNVTDNRANINALTGPRQTVKTITELFSYATVWWVFFVIASLFFGGGGVSRRLANLPYVLWVAAFNTSFLLGYIVIDMMFCPPPTSVNSQDRATNGSNVGVKVTKRTTESGSTLLEAINKKGLILFLFANLLTGAINLVVQTMYTSDVWAMVILSGYSGIICAVAVYT